MLKYKQRFFYLRNRIKFFRKSLYWYKRDFYNKLTYGRLSPLSCQKIYIDPTNLNRLIAPKTLKRKDSGRILGGDWDLNTSNIKDNPKYRICYERFVKGKTWDESGAYNLMLELVDSMPGVDGCYNINDIISRYNNLDKIYENVKREKRLLSSQELDKYNFREKGSIYVHIDRNANFIFGGGGWHRLAIAKILKLKSIPVQLGVVHEKAIGYWNKNCLP